MKVLDFYTRAPLACATFLVFAGCASQQTQIATPGTMPQGAATINRLAQAPHPGNGSSWMAPEASSQDLLYVTNVHTVTVYSFPQGTLVGTLNNFLKPSGECVDKAGDIFITDSSSQIFEYAHGGHKRIATLKDPLYTPEGCSVDPTTGNLAVANYETSSNYPGNVAVYRKAKGIPTSYIGFNFYYYFFCGYDASGNLFVDGQNNSGFGFEFGELRKGGRTIQNILLPQSITAPGGVAWDGTHVAVGDQGGAAIYQFDVRAGKASLAGTTPLGGTGGQVFQFGIAGSTVAVPVYFSGTSSGSVQLYNYPAGGSPTATITDGVNFPIDAVVSLASSR